MDGRGPRRRALMGGMLAAAGIALSGCDVGADDSADDGSSAGGGASDGGDGTVSDGGSDGTDSSDGTDGTDGAGGGGPGVEPAGTLLAGAVEISVGVVSVIRSEGVLVLTLEASAEDPDDQLPFGPIHELAAHTTSDHLDARQFDGVRLLDLAGDRVAVVAMDAEGRSVIAGPDELWADRDRSAGSAGTERVQLAYGDLDVDRVQVLIPKIGLVEGVPVIDADQDAAGQDAADQDAAGQDAADQDAADLSVVDLAPVVELSAFSVDLSTTASTTTTADSTTVSLGGDVLFDSSSAELSDDAQAVIEAAAAQIAEHAPGTVRVVGHTDDVDTQEVNRVLSEERAEAVAEVLATLIDAEDYPLEVSGKGESEPVADNGDAEGRALNRRVELTIDTPVVVEETVETELPELDGPEATGEEGVEPDGVTPTRIRALGARIVEDHLVVTLEFTRLDDAVGSSIGIGPFAGEIAIPGYVARTKSEVGIAVLDGSTATVPALHLVGEEGSVRRALTDLRTNSRLDGGRSRVSDLVYPRGTPVGDTVAVQLLSGQWRLTDIPVAR